MPTAAKHFDIVVGLDMHLVQPPGPVPPVPIPHPFVGIVFDPFDYLPLLGSTVTVSGLPRAQAGTAVMPIPPHIPIGGVFVKPPGNEGEVFMGSATVEVEGEPFGFMGVPALDCSDIGVPPPPRPPKNPDDAVPPKGGPMSLMLPSSVVLSIPIGRPVTVGGPPTISIFSAAFATASNAFAGLRKLQQRSERMRKVSRRMHDRAEQLMRAKGMSDTARHRVHTAICAVTGHPVDIATGKVFTDQLDFEFPAPLALAFERKWLSTSGHRGALGHGWHHGFDLELRVDEHTQLVAIRLADDRVLACPLLPVGERWFDRKDKLELVREASGFVLRERSGLRYGFVGSPSLGAAGEAAMPLAFVEDQAGHRIELVRDGAGRLLELLDAGRRRYPIAHDAEGRILSIHGPHPEGPHPSGRGEVLLARYVYDRAGDLVEVHDGLGRVRRYAYRNHLLVRETDRAGLSFHFEYDDESKGIAARCLRTWGDEGIYDHRLDYAETHTAVTNSLGQRSVFHHSATAPGLIERVVDPLGHTHRVELDEWGDEKSEVDELGRTTRRSHDARGNVIEQVWPDGTTARFAYDAHDQLIRAIDQNGGWWQWTRDERGRLLARHDPDGGGLRVVWRGPFIDAIVDAQGRATRLEYDAANALVRAHLPDRATLAWAHDGAGHRIAQTSPTGAVQRLVRDELGRVLEVHEPDGLVRRYHNRHRHFDPRTSGYLCVDPIGLTGGVNVFGYVDDPLVEVDPLGRATDRTPFPSRQAALDHAYDAIGVPRGTQPDQTWYIGNDPRRRAQPGFVFSDDASEMGWYRVFETPQGTRVIAEHIRDPETPPHFHAGMPQGDVSRNGVNFRSGTPDSEDYHQARKDHFVYGTPRAPDRSKKRNGRRRMRCQ